MKTPNAVSVTCSSEMVDSSEDERPLNGCNSGDEIFNTNRHRHHSDDIESVRLIASQRHPIDVNSLAPTTQTNLNNKCSINRPCINSTSTTAFLSGESGATTTTTIHNNCDRPSSKHQHPSADRHNLRDINAMSVASIYDTEHNEIMDADNEWIDDDEESIRNSIYDECYEHEPSELLLSHRMRSNVSGTTASPASTRVIQEEHMPDCESCYNEPPDPFANVSNTFAQSLYFNDGNRSIDFVLAWQTDDDDAEKELKQIKRSTFEENLRNEGLELEYENVEKLHFVKIHTPLEVLRRYAEILKLRMPMKESLCQVEQTHHLSTISNAALYISNKIPGFKGVQTTAATIMSQLKGFGQKLSNCILVDGEHFPERSQRFTAVYSRDKEYLFDVRKKCFFTAAIRSRIVQFILDRKRFTRGADDDYAFGIDRLINEGVYLAAYPLHDGEVKIPGSIRHLLYNEWAAVSKWYRYQPLDYIKEYFGVKIGLYFAWLGYYTYMLLLASIVGIACFLYSWFTIDTYVPSHEICNGNMSITMCPLCDTLCDYWELKETCMHVRITYLFDNNTTVFFAIFMSFWATLFLELWKRYSAEITHRWDLTGFDIHEEHPRPNYLARLAHVKKVRIDYITNTKEPQPPFWRMKLPAAVFSFSIVILLVAMAVAAVLGVVLYRMSVLAALSVKDYDATTSNLVTTVTAACINLGLIFIFNWMYTLLAEYLTEFEILRTQTEFDDSLTLKIYLLQFVNYYASIFYIAFFKGKFIGYPGQYNRFFDYRQEECGLGGCLTELCIQLAIIMIGKQAVNTILEMLMPIGYRWYNSVTIRLGRRKSLSTVKRDEARWLRDLKLVEWGPRSLFSEYLEMVLQYGFVTIFVAAFPLAPFFALLNNILEMRLDAKKLLTFHRRPVSQRVRDIGVWYRILDCIGKLSVITNGFIIAFTSEFIPRLVYSTAISEDGTLRGYLNHSLAYFDTNDFTNSSRPRTPSMHVMQCRYPDYREPPESDKAYQRTYLYWYILAARLAFVVIFENVVAIVMILVRWAIPDMSCKLRDQIRREAYITNEIIIKQEATRAYHLRQNSRDEATANGKLEPAIISERMEQLMSENLSSSQLDLVMHGPGQPTAPGHATPHQYEKVNNAFLESEKRNTNKMSSKSTSVDQNDATEMSSL